MTGFFGYGSSPASIHLAEWRPGGSNDESYIQLHNAAYTKYYLVKDHHTNKKEKLSGKGSTEKKLQMIAFRMTDSPYNKMLNLCVC